MSRHDSTEQQTEKNGPDSRQEVTGPLSESDTYQEASVMEQSTSTATTVDTADQPAATYTLDPQAKFFLHSHAPHDPGVVRLDVLQSTGDAVTLSGRYEDLQDLADWIFTSVDRIAAEEEAAADAAVDADEARMIADGAPLLRDLKWFLEYSDGWQYDNWPAAVEALTGDGYDDERLLYITDFYRAARVLEVSTVDLMQNFLAAVGQKGVDDE